MPAERLTVKYFAKRHYAQGLSDELLRTVESIPGAVGIVDVYSINSAVKVLRIDGKLPFDVGYPLKGN